ncbi:MAG: hypothetical protein MAG431_00351 [Chloroflexi bacterium]|nr:hypothetical protein [Chloroflexota bacterium]
MLYPPAAITDLLVIAQPQFSAAREDFDRAQDLRAEIDSQQLSPDVRQILLNQVDPLLPLMEDGFAIALSLPRLLGATEEGPKTYLILAQNEDELRPTGGFITAVGNLVLQDGKIVSLDFKDSGKLDNLETPYPMAPWQLQVYMNSRILTLRDSNWFTHFPTTVAWAEYLNAYATAHSVDGVIAFDQHFIVMLLREIGALEIEGISWPVTSGTVISYLRLSKVFPPEGIRLPDEGKKESVNKVMLQIFDYLETGDDVNPDALSKIFLQALQERHLLLQFDDQIMAEVIARYRWDGALRPGEGDFLMVVDSNIGFNKVNARVDRSFVYDVNLTDLENITSYLSVFHKNKVKEELACAMGIEGRDLDRVYPIEGCYWNYLRVYVPEGSELADVVFPPPVPGARMVLNRSLPEPHVDVLGEEIEGVAGFGALTVVPTGETAATGFEFTLPEDILTVDPDSGNLVYRLKIQKQPGTIADPVTVRLHLPTRATVESASPDAVVQGDNLLFKINLRTDTEIEVIFTAP